MIFGVIRIVVCAIVFFVLYTLINKSEKIEKKKKWSIGALVLCAVLASCLCLLPVENAIVTFQTPYDAYSYSNQGNVVLVVEGEKTTKVIAMEGDEYIHAVLPKTDKGWKLSSPFDEKRLGVYSLGSTQIMVTRYKDTEEYYLNILSLDGEELELSDAKGTKFLRMKETAEGVKIYHAYVKSYDSSYTLIVNGKSICIEKNMEKMF